MSRLDRGYAAHERTDRRPAADHPAEGAEAPGRRRTRWIVPAGVTAIYALFSLAVHLRMLDHLDLAVRDASRPGGVWGPLQVRSDRLVKELRPTHVGLPMLLIVAVLSIVRRSLRPILVVAVVGTPVAVVTLGTKWAMAHSEANPAPIAHGSFPSGHMVSIIMAFGLVVLLLRPGTRWGWGLPTLAGLVMGSALILATVHPATDVIGAALLCVAALTGASAAGVGQWADNRRGRSVG